MLRWRQSGQAPGPRQGPIRETCSWPRRTSTARALGRRPISVLARTVPAGGDSSCMATTAVRSPPHELQVVRATSPCLPLVIVLRSRLRLGFQRGNTALSCHVSILPYLNPTKSLPFDICVHHRPTLTINWPESPRIHAGDEWLLVVAEPMCSTACGPVALCQPNRVGGFRDTSFSRVQALAYWDEGALRWRMSRCCTAALRWSHRPFRAGQALAGSGHVGCRDDLRISRIYPGRVSRSADPRPIIAGGLPTCAPSCLKDTLITMQMDRFRTSKPLANSPALADLMERRTRLCRLHPDYALESIEEAETFVVERGLLTLTPDCSLPSLFGACHEEPYQPGGHGFASWPKTRWRWAFLLSERPGVHTLKLHHGKMLYLSPEAAACVDPICRQELTRAGRGDYGPLAAELVEYLEVAGPSLIDDVKHELNLEAPALRRIRERLERVGAVVSRAVVAPARGGEGE